MNGAHAHLLVNHIPLFGIFFGLVSLIWSIRRQSNDMRWAAVLLFVLAGVFAWVSMETGESAEDLVEHLPGVTKELIHTHEEAAEYAQIFALILAGAAFLMAILERYKPQFLKTTQIVVLLLALFTSTVIIRTTFLGGQIRHTEIRSE